MARHFKTQHNSRKVTSNIPRGFDDRGQTRYRNTETNPISKPINGTEVKPIISRKEEKMS